MFAIRFKGGLPVLGALLSDPRTEPVAIDRVQVRHSGVTVTFDVAQKLAEPLLPPVGTAVPRPAGQVLKSALAVGVKSALGMIDALLDNPRTEPVVIDHIRVRHSGVTLTCDVAQELAEPLLPLVGVGVPCPAAQLWSRRWRSASRVPLSWPERWLETHTPSPYPSTVYDCGTRAWPLRSM